MTPPSYRQRKSAPRSTQAPTRKLMLLWITRVLPIQTRPARAAAVVTSRAPALERLHLRFLRYFPWQRYWFVAAVRINASTTRGGEGPKDWASPPSIPHRGLLQSRHASHALI